jgi:hypothetical protein
LDLTKGYFPKVITGTRSICKNKVAEKYTITDHAAENMQKYFMIFDKNSYKLVSFV